MSLSPKFTRLTWITVAIAAISLGACTAVVNSTDQISLLDGACHSRLGSYSLPKTNLKLTVNQIFEGDSTEGYYVLEDVQFIRRADPRFTYCLDYLASPTSDDIIQVKRSKAQSAPTPGQSAQSNVIYTPFLQLVTSKAVDETAIIIRKLVRAIFIGLSQNANFNPARAKDASRTVLAADLEFDPFDPFDVALTNSRLKQLGFCVVLQDYSFDTRAVRPSRYCDNPGQVARAHPSIAAELVAHQPYVAPAEVRGIHYRPRAPYQLSIYVKDDPTAPEPWRLAKLVSVELENVSPVISLGVDRAIFAARRTALVFDDGTLQQVCIAKGSEMEGFIQIPVDVVNSIVALPSQMLKVQIESANLNQSVITQEQHVVALQQQYIDYKLGKGPKPAIASGDTNDGQDLTLDHYKPSSVLIPDLRAPEVNAISATDRLKDICNNLGNLPQLGGGTGL